MQRGSAIRGGRRPSGFFQQPRDPVTHPRGGGAGRGRGDSRGFSSRGRGAGSNRPFSGNHSNHSREPSLGPQTGGFRGRGGYVPRMGHQVARHPSGHNFNIRPQDMGFMNQPSLHPNLNYNMFAHDSKPNFIGMGNHHLDIDPNELAMQLQFQERLLKEQVSKSTACYVSHKSDFGNPLIPVIPRMQKP